MVRLFDESAVANHSDSFPDLVPGEQSGQDNLYNLSLIAYRNMAANLEYDDDDDDDDEKVPLYMVVCVCLLLATVLLLTGLLVVDQFPLDKWTSYNTRQNQHQKQQSQQQPVQSPGQLDCCRVHRLDSPGTHPMPKPGYGLFPVSFECDQQQCRLPPEFTAPPPINNQDGVSVAGIKRNPMDGLSLKRLLQNHDLTTEAEFKRNQRKLRRVAPLYRDTFP